MYWKPCYCSLQLSDFGELAGGPMTPEAVNFIKVKRTLVNEREQFSSATCMEGPPLLVLGTERKHKLFPGPSPKSWADIIVVGAGAAGATAAAVLGRQGWRVLLLDARATCPPVFKAEKIEHDELNLLRKFELLLPLFPHAGRISEICGAYDGRIFRRRRMEQIGISYADLVNTLRDNLPASVETRVGRAEHITRDGEVKRVHLTDGEVLSARLVVVASGLGSEVLAGLGLRRQVVQKEQSAALGFNIVASDSRPFYFQSVSYYPDGHMTGIDYLTLFKIRHNMRANLFLFRPGNDPWMREFIQEPRRMLTIAFPKLSQVIGEYQVAGKIDSSSVDLYRTEGDMPEGVVFIGDVLQNTCPSTGLGFKKIFTDISVLAAFVPAWLSTPGMGPDKLRRFYDHPRKRSADAYAMRSALKHRRAAIDPSLRWKLRRALLHLKWNLSHPKSFPQPEHSAKPRVIRVPARVGSASVSLGQD
jgi:2-polyprenyl-6-methoxyphenol hydroxylase-like FAD-dependent oxidoreductase